MFKEIIITHASCTVKEKKSTDDIFKYFYFSDLFQKTGFDITCKLSPKETVCMKCQILFSQKKKKKKKKKKNDHQILASVEFTRSVVKVKLETIS